VLTGEASGSDVPLGSEVGAAFGDALGVGTSKLADGN
jgi:hypothetical protein